MKIDLKNIDYLIPIESEVIWKFLIENNFNFITDVSYVVSKLYKSTYGVVFHVDDKLVFCKHHKTNKSCKIISKEEFNNNFIISDIKEISTLEMEQ